MLYPVILSGGNGTRLWPWSNDKLPKQFIKLLNKKTLLQNTLQRVKDPKLFFPPLIVSNQKHLSLIDQQSSNASIIAEPIAKGTAPAIIMAALILKAIDKDALMLVMPSDVYIKRESAFSSLLKQAELTVRRHNMFILFGMNADYVESGYGYIKSSESVYSKGCFKIEKFIEKPPPKIAKALIAQDYLWNSGIFILPVSLYLEEMLKHAPEVILSCVYAYSKTKKYTRENNKIFEIDKSFGNCPGGSIDQLLLEKTTKKAVIKCNVGWSDIGSWKALFALKNKDKKGNVFEGKNVAINCNNLHVINNNPKHLIALIGAKDLTVVNINNVTLILSREHSQKVKQLVAQLKKRNNRLFAKY